MPFVTEEIWQHIKPTGNSLMSSEFPVTNESLHDQDAEARMGFLMEAIIIIRNIRGEMGISPSRELKTTIYAPDDSRRDILSCRQDYIYSLANLESLTIIKEGAEPEGAATGVASGMKVFVLLDGLVDIAQERARLEKEISKVAKDMAFVAKKLANRDFLNKAAEAVVQKEEEKYRELRGKHSALETALEKFQQIRTA